ncbi:hypothetical protein NDU88_002642 [Pleurodeles waltl]|uniref:Uncharacterized protein n=1 Tax=Pleurodeles waltl TaxID=8319 RepID=A0AAV7QAI6_PLEWA|nr:hypothetical protein NDU88_002642 [Pleurodeles waltl]
MLPTSRVGGLLASTSEGDVIERAWHLVSHLRTKKGSQGCQGKEMGLDHCEGSQKANHPSLTPPVEGQVALAPASFAQQVASASGVSTQQSGNAPAVVTTTVMSSLTQEWTNSGTGHPSPLVDLGDINSEHEQLGQHVAMEMKEKIWKVAYIDIFELLVDKSDKDEVKRRKECAHSRVCGHWLKRKKVEESLSNWVKAFSIYQAILAERFSDLGAHLAYYKNRIVGGNDEYGGTA